MLRNLGHSFPFYIIRILIVTCEALTLAFGAYMLHGVVMDIASRYVDSLFLTMLNPMGWIIGLAISAFVVKYPFGLIKYYIKIAHIIYMTMITLEYKPSLIGSFGQAYRNFSWLFINDIATKGIVQALRALKDAILNVEILQKFKAPDSSLLKFVTSLCTNGLNHIIDMTDELIISYTWFTNDMLLASLERRGKDKPSTIKAVKNQAKFILEGMAFLVRTLPQLLISTLIIEAAFLFLSNVLLISIIASVFYFSGYSFVLLLAGIFLYRMLLDLIYYALVEPIRIAVYIYAFYSELSELEPIDIKQEIASLIGKVPVIGALAKKAGMKVEPVGNEGESLFNADFNGVIKDNVATVADAFNLNVDDLMEDVVEEQRTRQNNTEPQEVEVASSVEEEEAVVEVEEETLTPPPPPPPQQQEPTPPPQQPTTVEMPTVEVEEIEIDTEPQVSSDPFASSSGPSVVPPKRRRRK